MTEKLSPVEINKTVSQAIKQTRLKQGIPISEIASAIGSSATKLRNQESGLVHYSVGEFVAIALALDEAPANLFDPQGRKHPEAYRECVALIEHISSAGHVHLVLEALQSIHDNTKTFGLN